jgi:hypothetical protein
VARAAAGTRAGTRAFPHVYLRVYVRGSIDVEAGLGLVASYLKVRPRPALNGLAVDLDPQAPSLGAPLLAQLQAGRAPALQKLELRDAGKVTAEELHDLLDSGCLSFLAEVHIIAPCDLGYRAWRALSGGKLNALVRQVQLWPTRVVAVPGARASASSRGFVDAVLARGCFPNLELIDMEEVIVTENTWERVLTHLGSYGGRRWRALGIVYLPSTAPDSVLSQFTAVLPEVDIVRMPR